MNLAVTGRLISASQPCPLLESSYVQYIRSHSRYKLPYLESIPGPKFEAANLAR